MRVLDNREDACAAGHAKALAKNTHLGHVLKCGTPGDHLLRPHKKKFVLDFECGISRIAIHMRPHC